jgi:hypothetical protein
MSMYGVNSSGPKTLVRHLVRPAAETLVPARRALLRAILDTPVSPELLPPQNGEISQRTEQIVGPYDLHDFFLYQFVRYGFVPGKILRLAEHAFAGSFDRATIKQWLTVFLKRFFSQQFKRSCLPDAPRSVPSPCRRAATGACPVMPRHRSGSTSWKRNPDLPSDFRLQQQHEHFFGIAGSVGLDRVAAVAHLEIDQVRAAVKPLQVLPRHFEAVFVSQEDDALARDDQLALDLLVDLGWKQDLLGSQDIVILASRKADSHRVGSIFRASGKAAKSRRCPLTIKWHVSSSRRLTCG